MSKINLNSKEFRDKLKYAISDGVDQNYRFNGEYEELIESFNINTALDSVIELLKQELNEQGNNL